MSDATAGRREPGPFRAPRIKARKRRSGARLALVALAALLAAGLLAGLSTPLGRGSASDGPPFLPSLLGSTDTDGDGCSDAQELGPNQTMGGRRDPTSFWDFFDTPDAAGLRDRAITVADIFRVAARIGTTGGATTAADALAPVPTTGYHAAFDRTPAAPGTDPWDLRAADGSVSVGDIAASVIQFGHTCAQIGPTSTRQPTSTATRTPTPSPTMTPTPTSVPSSIGAGSRIPWEGGAWYLHGANMPWYNWACDFGCGPNGGASSPSVQVDLAAGFSQLQQSGGHVARWWVFPGDAWQISRDGSGAPAGVNPAVYADFDAALQLAESYDLYFVFTLFSAPSHIPQSWLDDAEQRSQLASALGELFAHYADNPRVLTWQVFNEPEWDIWNNAASQASVQATVRAIAEAVHANSDAYVSVGAAMLDGLPMWQGLGLDYYTAHWYDYMSGGNWCARCTDYAEVRARYDLDAPLVIGEFYAGSDSDALARFEDFYDKGYAGGWPWSLFPDHTNDHLAIDLAAAQDFANQHGDLGP